MSCDRHAGGESRRVYADEVNEGGRDAFQANHEIRLTVERPRFRSNARVGPSKVLFVDLRKELAGGRQEELLWSWLFGRRRRAWPDVQPSIGTGTDVNAFGSRTSRNCGVNERSYVPTVNAADQFVVVAANEFDLVFAAAGHRGDAMSVEPGGIDQDSSVDVSV